MPKEKEKSKDKSKDKKKSDKSVDKDKKEKDSKKDKKDKSEDGGKKSKDKDKKVKIEEVPVVPADPIEVPVVQEVLPEPIVEPPPIFAPIVHEDRLCLRHKQPIKYFCETSEEPVCEQCTIQGPHNTHLHRICNLNDAFNRRAGKLTFSIEHNLREKAMMLGAQLHRVEYRIEEIKYVETIIERDTRVEYGGILERLNSAEGVKLSVLHHDIENLQRELSSINEVGHTFFKLVKDPSDPVPFLREARRLWEAADYLTTKPFNPEINVFPYDLPRELQEMRSKLSSVEVNEQLIAQKDDIIWKLLQDKDNYDTFSGATQFEEDTNAEINEWARLVDNCNSELQNRQMICFFCGVAAEERTVNKKCIENKKTYTPSTIGFTTKQPKVKYYGKRLHFFGKPLEKEALERIRKLRQPSFPLIEMQSIQSAVAAKSTFILTEALRQITDDEGYVSNVKFCAMLVRSLELSIEEIEKVIAWLDPSNIGKLSANYFQSALKEIATNKSSRTGGSKAEPEADQDEEDDDA